MSYVEWVAPEEEHANTTRQEDGPAYRPPDGLRLSKNARRELPDAFFPFPAAVFAIPAAF
jgi:hypothetical protein